jgi:hypothetical protein
MIMILKVVIKLVVRANFMMDSQIVNGKWIPLNSLPYP